MEKTGAHSVMLTRAAGGTFRRTVRDAEGQPLKDEAGNDRVLLFNPGQPVELTAEELEAVRDDIGKVLSFATLKDAKPVPKPDDEATRKFVEETNKKRAEQRAADAAEKKEAEAQRQALLRATGAPPAPSPRRVPVAPQTAARTGHRGDLESKDK